MAETIGSDPTQARHWVRLVDARPAIVLGPVPQPLGPNATQRQHKARENKIGLIRKRLTYALASMMKELTHVKNSATHLRESKC
jgi:hypothetical protein